MSNLELYHRIYGENNDPASHKPAVFLHGLMGYAANWGRIWPAIAEQRPVLVVDQRGHGRSPKPETGYAPEDYAGDIYHLIGKLGWQSVHLVGHSMGGRVANQFAASFPQHTQSVTFEDSGMIARPDRLEWIKNLLGEVPTPFADKTSARAFFDKNYADDPLVGGFLFSNLVATADGKYDWRFHGQGMIETIEKGRAISAMDIFKSIKSSILVIRGSESTEFVQEEAERMAEENSRSQLAVVEGAGHFVHVEKAEEFIRLVQTFFAEND